MNRRKFYWLQSSVIPIDSMPVCCASTHKGLIVYHNQSLETVPKSIFWRPLRCLDIHCGRAVYPTKSECGTKLQLTHANTITWCPRFLRACYTEKQDDDVIDVVENINVICKRLRIPKRKCNKCNTATQIEKGWEAPYVWLSRGNLFIHSTSQSLTLHIPLSKQKSLKGCILPDFVKMSPESSMYSVNPTRMIWVLQRQLKFIMIDELCERPMKCKPFNCMRHDIQFTDGAYVLYKVCRSCGVFYKSFGVKDLDIVSLRDSHRVSEPYKIRSAAVFKDPSIDTVLCVSDSRPDTETIMMLLRESNCSRFHFSKIDQDKTCGTLRLFSETPEISGLCMTCSKNNGSCDPVCLLCHKKSSSIMCFNCNENSGLTTTKSQQFVKHSHFVHERRVKKTDFMQCMLCEEHAVSYKICRKSLQSMWPSNADAPDEVVDVCIDCISFCLDCKEPIFWLEPTGMCKECIHSRRMSLQETALLKTQQHCRLTILPSQVT